MSLEKGTITFTENDLGEFPTKLVETPISGSNIKAKFDYSIPKPKGRPKGSKNKPKSKVEELYNEAWPGIDESVTIHGDTEWVLASSEVIVRLQSHEVPEGLEMVLQRHVIVGLSALPNGNASIITNIGTDQPLILVTAEPYVDIKKRLYPGLS